MSVWKLIHATVEQLCKALCSKLPNTIKCDAARLKIRAHGKTDPLRSDAIVIANTSTKHRSNAEMFPHAGKTMSILPGTQSRPSIASEIAAQVRAQQEQRRGNPKHQQQLEEQQQPR
jgi:AICAR transformylase/IMP cyclohydrolase PurH